MAAFERKQTTPWLGRTIMKDGDRLNIGGYQIWMEDNKLHTDRTEVFEPGNGPVKLKNQFELALDGEEHELTIVADDHLIEIFVDQGRYVLSNVVYHLGTQISGHFEEILVPGN